MRLSKYPLVFVQIPKCGSGSINDILRQSGGHRPVSWLKENMTPDEWKKRTSFAFVRHPYDRFISIRAHFKSTEQAHLFYYMPPQSVPRMMLQTQDWFLDDEIDHIFPFEEYRERWSELAEKFDIPAPLGRKNYTSNKIPLTDKEKEFIYTTYRADFERFGFQP